jgi:hypothetical protein
MTLYLHTEYVGAHSNITIASSFTFYRFEYSRVNVDVVQNSWHITRKDEESCMQKRNWWNTARTWRIRAHAEESDDLFANSWKLNFCSQIRCLENALCNVDSCCDRNFLDRWCIFFYLQLILCYKYCWLLCLVNYVFCRTLFPW